MKNVGISKMLTLSEHEHLWAATPLPMLLVDVHNHIVFANDASESFLGRSRKNLLGSNISDALKCSDERFNLALSAMEGNLSAQDMELDMASGLAIADLFVSVVSGDAPRRLVVVSPRHGGRAHISEHNEAGDQLAMGAPAILGHEIKNPLAGIKGAAQLLARQIDEKQKPLTDLIVNEVDRIARLLDQMQIWVI
jgi:two-component system, NtrC family, nitrogen regulation sensor histidine kinase GlnL